jgi:hypothetical protein
MRNGKFRGVLGLLLVLMVAVGYGQVGQLFMERVWEFMVVRSITEQIEPFANAHDLHLLPEVFVTSDDKTLFFVPFTEGITSLPWLEEPTLVVTEEMGGFALVTDWLGALARMDRQFGRIVDLEIWHFVGQQTGRAIWQGVIEVYSLEEALVKEGSGGICSDAVQRGLWSPLIGATYDEPGIWLEGNDMKVHMQPCDAPQIYAQMKEVCEVWEWCDLWHDFWR